jgi:hypothetical protein
VFEPNISFVFEGVLLLFPKEAAFILDNFFGVGVIVGTKLVATMVED